MVLFNIRKSTRPKLPLPVLFNKRKLVIPKGTLLVLLKTEVEGTHWLSDKNITKSTT